MRYILALLLTGCSQVFDAPEKPKIVYPQFQFVIVESSAGLAENEAGRATVFPNMKICAVQLKTYPRCLLHEIRHCIEGKWHGDTPNGDDCDV